MDNAIFGWLWILVGMLAGGVLGLGFQREDWLGGYSSLRRRLLRLGHVACIALGALNVLHALQAPALSLTRAQLELSSQSLLLGALAMPLCCLLMAFKPRVQPLFAVPVVLLLTSLGLTLRGLLPT